MDDKRVILFCVNNPRSPDEHALLRGEGCVSRDCLGVCTRCFETRLLVVADHPIEGADYASILAEARARLEAQNPSPMPTPPTSPPPNAP